MQITSVARSISAIANDDYDAVRLVSPSVVVGGGGYGYELFGLRLQVVDLRAQKPIVLRRNQSTSIVRSAQPLRRLS